MDTTHDSEYQERHVPATGRVTRRASDPLCEEHGNDSEAPVFLGIVLALMMSLPMWMAILWLIL